MDNLRNEYHLQAVVTPIPESDFASCCQLKSIMIPRTHKYIHCRWSYVTPTGNSGDNYTVGTETYEISTLSVGALLGSELYIEYEGVDNEYHYFHSVFDGSWKDNSLLVYSK